MLAAPPISLTLAVILCTRNRPHDLARCLASLGAQTQPPDEIWIIDASDQPQDAQTLAADLPGAISDRIHYVHAQPGLPAQRNLGLRQTTADIVAFFDDDVELAPDYLAELLALYARHWHEGIGGACGSTPGWRQSSEGAWWLKRLFGLTHVRATADRVRLLPGMGMAWVAQPPAEIRCDALPGHCMSFRRAALAGISFDESLGGYADGEDIDVGIQVGRKFALWQTPSAQLVHHKSRVERSTLRRRFFTRTRNERYLHRKLMPHTAFFRLAWGWSAIGRTLIGLMVSARQRTLDPVRGVLAGLRDEARSR